jgi:hypothetical protein
MSGISQIQKGLKELVIDNCWEYLRDNFHKLNENNKIKVSMALCTKSIPQKIEGDQGPAVVIMGEIKRSDGSPLRYNLGSRNTSEVIEAATEAVSGN